MARREHFFEFNWGYFIGLIAFVVGAWMSDGLWLVLGSLAAAGIIAGVWFLFWQRRHNRSE